jgi:cobalt/nickel transport system permease protein
MGAGHAHTLHVHGHSYLHRMAPQVKVAGAFLFVLGVALTPRTAVAAFVVDAVVLAVLIRVAGLPVRFVVTRAMVVLPFIVFALFLPFIGTGERQQILGVAVSVDGLWGTFNVLAKAGLGITVSILLAGTTEIPRMLTGLERLRVPPVLTAIAAFMLRYLEVVAGELQRMRTAMTARGYDPRWLWQARPIAAASGALFVRSYERGERIHQAMLSRGFTGAMPDLHPDDATTGEWIQGLVPAAISLGLALTSVVLS